MITAHLVMNFLMKKRRFAINLKIFSMPYAVWLFLFSVLPMVFVLYYSITNSENNQAFFVAGEWDITIDIGVPGNCEAGNGVEDGFVSRG